MQSTNTERCSTFYGCEQKMSEAMINEVGLPLIRYRFLSGWTSGGSDERTWSHPEDSNRKQSMSTSPIDEVSLNCSAGVSKEFFQFQRQATVGTESRSASQERSEYLLDILSITYFLQCFRRRGYFRIRIRNRSERFSTAA